MAATISSRRSGSMRLSSVGVMAADAKPSAAGFGAEQAFCDWFGAVVARSWWRRCAIEAVARANGGW
jgi:hypothetical protein